MHRTGVARLWPLAVGFAVLAATVSGPAPAQPGAAAKTSQPAASVPANVNAQRVPVTTADGVELDGTYFPSPAAGRNAPCVMMVHKYGTDRSKVDWIGLAVKLQEAGLAVLTFDLRGHGNSTQLSNPDMFWRQPFNRNGIRGGTSPNRKSVIDYKDFKPSYFPFLVNDLAAARRFFELKNDAGEVNVHSLTILGAQEGAGLGFLFTAAEYNRIYRVGVTALQSNGTSYNAGEDIAAGVWLSLTMRPATPSGGGPNYHFNMVNWIRSHPLMRDRTPMCFIFGVQDRASKNDSETVFKMMSGTGSRPEQKLNELKPIPGTNLAGPALLGQPALNVPELVFKYCQKVLADRKAIPWTEVKPEANPLGLVPLGPFGVPTPSGGG
jgi:pimeloyl-ACP methyl ester carboxylesterase